MKILVSIGGASGSIYGIRVLEELLKAGHEIHLIFSTGAEKILEYETSLSVDDIKKQAFIVYENDDLFAAPASGSFRLDAMIIVPCSMKTLSAIAHGYCDTLTARAAVCCLKENRHLILVPRETPLDFSSLQNMCAAKQAGAIILPAMPGFYHQPRNLDDLVDFIVGKILDQLNIDHGLYTRWK